MVCLTTCPKCSQDVTIPDGVPREASVRCPLCEAEFPLSEVVDSMREVIFAADVPELELVELAPAGPDALDCEPEALPGDPQPLPGEPELVFGGTVASGDESPLDVELLDDVEEHAEDEGAFTSSSGEQQESYQADDSHDSVALIELPDPVPGDEPTNQADLETTEQAIAAEVLEAEVNGQAGDEADGEEDGEEDQTNKVTGDEPTEPAEPDAAANGDETSDADDASGDAPLSVRCPCCEAEFPLHTLIVAATGDPLGEKAAAAVASDGSPASGPVFDFALATDNSSSPASGAFDFAADSESSEGESPSLTVAKGKRKKKEKSLAGELFGVFVGGVAGLLIMYYGLNFFGGERFDMAEIYLPGIQHTAKHRPDWWPDWLLFDSHDRDFQPTDQPDPGLDPADFGNGEGLVWRPVPISGMALGAGPLSTHRPGTLGA